MITRVSVDDVSVLDAVPALSLLTDTVVFGSPGLGTSDVGNLGLAPGRTYVVEARQDVVAGRSGFGPPETVVDRPGSPRMVLRRERASTIRFGRSGNARLSIEVGCHLSAAEDGAR